MSYLVVHHRNCGWDCPAGDETGLRDKWQDAIVLAENMAAEAHSEPYQVRHALGASWGLFTTDGKYTGVTITRTES